MNDVKINEEETVQRNEKMKEERKKQKKEYKNEYKKQVMFAIFKKTIQEKNQLSARIIDAKIFITTKVFINH